MKTFRYWAKFEGFLLVDGVERKAAFLGGSNSSEEDARNTAIRKFESVQRRISGHKNEFESYEAEIREELIEEIDESAVITRNRYGAHVLNTEKQMILDVDEPPVSFFDLFARRSAEWKLKKLKKVTEKLHISLGQPSLGFRIYQTCKGFRVIVTGQAIVPKEALADRISRKLNADPLYWHLCKKQNCYRARLTPKPYRIKYRTIKIKVPADAQFKEEIASWERGYWEKSKNYSVCRYAATVGSDNANDLILLHDKYTRANESRKLA
ncbi:MAG: hypothetical protein R2941_00155 [Desulfobacterales bacterium]